MSEATPSVDPADQDSLIGLLKATYEKMLQGVDDMLPAKVIAFDRAKNRVQVQPMITMITTAGERVPRSQLASLPVMQFGGGGVVLLFDLKAGDLGWIKANDRDTSLFLQRYAECPPNTVRKHSFNDAVFVPDVMKGWTLNGEDAHNTVLQTLDGVNRIAVGEDGLKLTSGPSSITITPAAINIISPIITLTSASGTMTIGGGAAGTDITGTIKNNGVNIGSTHVHSQGDDSNNDTEVDTEVPH